MDAFFASVEEVLNPQLVTKSIIIACNFDERSVVSTCNYRARKYGVKSGMSLKKAIKKCPRAVICQPNFDKYQYFHNKFIKLIKKFCSKIEIVSIDECYLDVTDLCKKDSITPINLAIKIQSSVLKNTKLSCSIGIGDNRFMAKLACGMQKPHGITILSKKDLVDKIWPLDVNNVPFIGSHSQLVLNRDLNIYTIGDLAKCNYDLLTQKIGDKLASNFYANAHGNGNDEIISEFVNNKSISCGETLMYNTKSDELVCYKINELCKSLFARYRNTSVKGISLVIKDANFANHAKSIRINQAKITLEELLYFAKLLYYDFFTNILARTITIHLLLE